MNFFMKKSDENKTKSEQTFLTGVEIALATRAFTKAVEKLVEKDETQDKNDAKEK